MTHRAVIPAASHMAVPLSVSNATKLDDSLGRIYFLRGGIEANTSLQCFQTGAGYRLRKFNKSAVLLNETLGIQTSNHYFRILQNRYFKIL